MFVSIPKRRKERKHIIYKKVKRINPFVENEIALNNKYNCAPFLLHFDRILSFKKVHFGDLEYAELLEEKDHLYSYVLLEYERSPSLYSFLKKRSFSEVLDAYRYLLHGLCWLHKEKRVHMNITEHTVLCTHDQRYVFSQNDHCIPIHSSELLSFLSSSSSSTSSSSTTKYNIYWCIELQLLSYIVKRQLSSLSLSNLEEVWWGFLSSFENTILDVFKEWKEQWFFQMQKYINRPLNEIVTGLLGTAGSWNVYSLHIAFLHCFPEFDSFSRWLLLELNPFERKLPNATLEALDHFMDGFKG
jgi:hypothetical protein